jgi:hypothetical protein
MTLRSFEPIQTNADTVLIETDMDVPPSMIVDCQLAVHCSCPKSKAVQHPQPPSLKGTIESWGVPRGREGTSSLSFTSLLILLQEFLDGRMPYPHLSRHCHLMNLFCNPIAHALDWLLEFRRRWKSRQRFLLAPTRMPVTHSRTDEDLIVRTRRTLGSAICDVLFPAPFFAQVPAAGVGISARAQVFRNPTSQIPKRGAKIFIGSAQTSS